MTRTRRWVVVAALAAAVVGAPVALAAWPVADGDATVVEVLAGAQSSDQRGWSGYVETRGTLQLPSADRFDSVGALFGEEIRMRAWWRDDDAWRVDQLSTAGETDLVRGDDLITEWNYESGRVNVSPDPEIRLPRASDLLPPVLGERVLADADPASTSRLPARRVAGRVALGLRVQGSSRSSIERADVWVDESSGVPLHVEIFAAGDADPSFRSTFLDFDPEMPSSERVSFVPPADAERSFDDVLDIADAANQYAHVAPPADVAGLDRSDSSDGAVGVYGSGLTQLIAIPLRDREAVPLREQLQQTRGSREVPAGTVVAVGPLGVMLTGGEREGGWLLAGTVTGATLETAALDVLAGATVRDHD